MILPSCRGSAPGIGTFRSSREHQRAKNFERSRLEIDQRGADDIANQVCPRLFQFVGLSARYGARRPGDLPKVQRDKDAKG